jgi:hypothetical protein
MKKKLLYAAGIVFVIFMLVTNFSFLRFFLPQTYPHTWCSDQCRFWTMEKAKGHDPLKSVEMAFDTYKIQANKPNLILHRRFYRKWWQVWNWYDFMSNRCWTYPYSERDEDT